MHSFVRTTLSICHLEIQGRLDVEKVMDDMVGVVEMSWIEKDLLDVRKQLADSKTLANMLATEANELKREKEFYDTELERIRSEAVSVRECLMQDVSSILSERRHINKYQRRIRELEDKVIELVQFVKNGSQNEGDVNQPFRSIDPQMSDENSFNQSYKFADSVVEAISSVDSASRLPTLQDSTSDPHDLLSGLEDSNLLLILSYMDVSAVSVVSQLSRHIFARLDILFQNGSGSVKDSWLTRRNTQNSTAPLTNGHQPGDLTVEVTKNADAEGSYAGSSETTNGTKSPQTNGNGNGLDGPQSATKTPSGDARYFGKFSMLLAAADMLPTGLTVGVMNAVGVKMNVIPSSPASSSNGSSYGKNNSVSKPANTSAVAPVVVNGVAVGSGGTISAGGLTREIAESLSKKLSAVEMKAIINMDDLLKKNTLKLEISIADNEDFTSKLQGILTMRDFLITKLKGAEVALKASMVESTVLRKQAKADEEVINYLDLRGQEFEGKNAELIVRSEQLQAAYNLQCGSYSHRESQLFTELAEYKTKYDDLEIMYRSHKRVLVKEVKSLRGQLTSISSERNKYITQLLTVKNVLNLNGDSGNQAISENVT